MPKEAKTRLLDQLRRRSRSLRRLPKAQSLYDAADGAARVYIRYSKRHPGNRTFYGLRERDLAQLEGRQSLIIFLWDEQPEPLIVPYGEFEEVFHATSPAADGQYKSQIYLQPDGAELYIAGAGRFNVESYFGWELFDTVIERASLERVPDLTHAQVQTLLGAIGSAKGLDVWIPPHDRGLLDWSLATPFEPRIRLPSGYAEVASALQEVDVVWVRAGSNDPCALFEVEHSTPIYSGLLRFNDIHLSAPRLQPRFSIVANDLRRATFVRHLNRPIFRASGLNQLCSFLEYVNVFGWYRRLSRLN